MGTESTYYQNIIGRLRNLNRKEYTLFALLGLELLIIIILTVFTSFTIIESFWYFSSYVRTIIFFIFLIIVFASAGVLFIYPLGKYFEIGGRLNYFEKARTVGLNFPEVKDDLLNAMELVSIDKSRSLYSASLIDEAFKSVYNRTEHIDFGSFINFQKVRQLFYILSAVVIICILSIILIPGLNASAARLIQFDKEFIPPGKFIFEVSPGNIQMTRGDNVNINIRVKGEKPDKVFIAVKNEEQTEFENKELKPDSTGNYNYLLSSVRSSFRYFAFAEDIRSEEYNIEVIERPVIKTFDVTVTSPGYSKIPPHKQKDNGNITALIGSMVDIKLSSTKELLNGKIVFGDTTESALQYTGSSASGSFKVRGDNNYKIILTDISGENNLNPITYEINTIYDSYPQIEMNAPEGDVSLPNDNRVPVSAKISDDFGFSKLNITYRLSASKYSPVWDQPKHMQIPVSSDVREADISHIWNLTTLGLAVDDVVTCYLEIFDNDNVNGPKSSRSREFSIRVPSLEEILAKADVTHGEVQKDLQQTLKEAEELKKNLEKIDQDLKQNKKDLTWEEKEKIEKALNKFEELQEKMKESGQELSKMQQDLQQNDLLSKETMEKYMELQKLFEELGSEEMKQAMERLQKMMEQMNRKNTQEALEQVKLDEERFKKSIERTMNLLKRLQVEQKIDELKKRTEEAAKNQEELEKETNDKNLAGEKEKNELARKQDDISKQMEKLEEEMKKLSEKMSEIPDMPKEEMDKALQEMEEQQNEQLSEQAKQEIMKNQKPQAMQKQQKLSSNMKSMNKKMQQMQESMMQMNQMQTFTDMMRLLENLISLSKQQEQLRKESELLDPGSSQFKDNIQKQDNIQRNLDKMLAQMSSLSQKTFAITPEMGKSLGDAKREMAKSLTAMQNRNKGEAFNSQGEAMGSLNEAASMMKSSMESMMQGGGQGGMMSLMQQMGQLSQQQMNLNNLTQMLQQGQQGQLSPEQQTQLQRLTQQQELIRKSVEQLNKEARESGQSKTLPGNLENIAKEMQEIISNMNTQKLDDNLVQKQEKILSRMLDIQKSINERDFEKKRESNTGENIVYESPSQLNLSSQSTKDKLREELNRAVKEGYSKDYENLIRKYYELLQEKRN
jgi:hypothetical protein